MSDQPNIPTPDEQAQYLRTIDIPATVRQILYGVGSVGCIALTWCGAEKMLDQPTMAAGFGIAALLFMLATGKTDTTRAVTKKNTTAPDKTTPAAEPPA